MHVFDMKIIREQPDKKNSANDESIWSVPQRQNVDNVCNEFACWSLLDKSDI